MHCLRRLGWASAGLAFLCLTSACCGKPPDPVKVKRPIRVAYAPVVLNTPLYLAQDRGWFAEAGVDVDAKPFTTANDMVNALITSQVDVITGVSLVPLLNLEIQSPGKFRVLIHSRMTEEQAYDGIVVKKDSPIRNLDGLKGKRIAVYPGTTATNLFRAFLKKKGMAVDSVQLVQLPPPSHLSALSAGSVDALFAYEPTLRVAENGGAKRIFGSVFVALGDPSPISASVVSRTYERHNVEEVKKFAVVLDRAIRAIREDPAAARQTLIAHTKLAPEVAPKVRLVADVLSTETDPALVQRFVDLLVQIGELKSPIEAIRLLKAD